MYAKSLSQAKMLRIII